MVREATRGPILGAASAPFHDPIGPKGSCTREPGSFEECETSI